jgi:hypothetical protein
MSNSLAVVPIIRKNDSWIFPEWNIQLDSEIFKIFIEHSKEVCNDGISLVISSGKIPNYDMFIKLISKNDNFILYATESNVIKLPVELQDKLPNIDFLYVTVKGLNYE